MLLNPSLNAHSITVEVFNYDSGSQQNNMMLDEHG